MARATRIIPVAWLFALAVTGAARGDEPAASRDELTARRHLLREEIAFEKARLALTKGKAFYLVVDAPSRTLTLELNGVPLRTCTIERLEMDRRMVARRRAVAFHDTLGTPLILLSKTGTIPDTPPPVDADTTHTKEAEKRRKQARFSDADLTLTYDHDLLIHITTQADSVETAGRVQTRFQNRWRLLRLMVRSWVHGGPFRKQGEIFLQIGRTDARALYWALPDSSGLALRL